MILGISLLSLNFRYKQAQHKVFLFSLLMLYHSSYVKIQNFKVGIVGSGYWGTNILKTLEDLKIKNVYVYDLSKNN